MNEKASVFTHALQYEREEESVTTHVKKRKTEIKLIRSRSREDQGHVGNVEPAVRCGGNSQQ